ILQGGETTVFGNYITIFEQPAANLTSEEINQHRLSDVAFGDIFVTSPAINNYGLGPLFNQNSCESCHLSNGRSPFPRDAAQLKGLLLRISVPGENQYGGTLPVPG
ncbi:MAG: thiol oxidoreductase, partial [Bacteroidota bacterium]|nr:thiol oxidoreductase [Bacteroidota bacterium]